MMAKNGITAITKFATNVFPSVSIYMQWSYKKLYCQSLSIIWHDADFTDSEKG